MSEQSSYMDVDQAFDVGRQEWADYLEQRPYKNEHDQAFNPETGNIMMDPDSYFDNHRRALENQGSGMKKYEDMSLFSLARKQAQAEFYKDKTMAADLAPAVEQKLTEANQQAAGKRDQTYKIKQEEHSSAQDLRDRIEVIKQREIKKLQAEKAAQEVAQAQKQIETRKPIGLLNPGSDPETEDQNVRPKYPPAPQTDDSESRYPWQREFSESQAYDLATALNDYADLTAGRRRISSLSHSNSEKKVDGAQEQFEALRRDSKVWMSRKMHELGFNEAEKTDVSRLEDREYAKQVAAAIKFTNENPKSRRILSRTEQSEQTETQSPVSPDDDTKEMPAVTKQGRFAGWKDRAHDRYATLRNKVNRHSFYDLWASWGGGENPRERRMGTVKKVAVMAGIGLPIGAAAGIAGVFLAGPIVGGVAAAGVARGVARGLARSHIEANAEATVAAKQFEKHLEAQLASIDAMYDQGATYGPKGTPQFITEVYADKTRQIVERNRKRLGTSALIGAIFGAAGAAVMGELVHGHISLWGGGKPAATHPSGVLHHPVPQPKPPVTPAHHPQPAPRPPVSVHGPTGQEFNVENGSGIIREIGEYGQAHHYAGINSEKASHIYQLLHEQFGRHIVKLDTGRSTYMVGSDVRLSHPGAGRWWNPQVERILREDLAKSAA